MPRITSTTIPDVPSRDAVNEGALRVYEAEGYIKDGKKDRDQVRERLIEILSGTRVTGRSVKERNEKAISRGELITQVFPHLDPDYASAEDPALAEAIWCRVEQDIWNQLQTGARGMVQRAMANGDVLCRARRGTDRVWTVYITPSSDNAIRDQVGPMLDAFRRGNDREVENILMLIERLPAEDAKRLMQSWVRPVKAIQSAASERLSLAVEAAVARAAVPATPEPAPEPEPED